MKGYIGSLSYDNALSMGGHEHVFWNRKLGEGHPLHVEDEEQLQMLREIFNECGADFDRMSSDVKSGRLRSFSHFYKWMSEKQRSFPGYRKPYQGYYTDQYRLLLLGRRGTEVSDMSCAYITRN